jgi:hypothetical protein
MLLSSQGRVQRLGNNIHPPMDFIIHVAKNTVALQLIRRHAKPNQHRHQYETIPELQTPLDGFENHLFNAIAVAAAGDDKFRAELFSHVRNMNVE